LAAEAGKAREILAWEREHCLEEQKSGCLVQRASCELKYLSREVIGPDYRCHIGILDSCLKSIGSYPRVLCMKVTCIDLPNKNIILATVLGLVGMEAEGERCGFRELVELTPWCVCAGETAVLK
jgi:hypothetical protein